MPQVFNLILAISILMISAVAGMITLNAYNKIFSSSADGALEIYTAAINQLRSALASIMFIYAMHSHEACEKLTIQILMHSIIYVNIFSIYMYVRGIRRLKNSSKDDWKAIKDTVNYTSIILAVASAAWIIHLIYLTLYDTNNILMVD